MKEINKTTYNERMMKSESIIRELVDFLTSKKTGIINDMIYEGAVDIWPCYGHIHIMTEWEEVE